MQTIRVIPCLDIDSGRVVKGTNFVGLRDAGDPVELAERYSAEGADEIVFLDISATVEGRDTTVELVRRVAERVAVPFTVGGGIRSVDSARALIDAGASKVSVASAAIDRPELISDLAGALGSHRIVVAIDAQQQEGPDGAWFEVLTRGGREGTGLDAVEWAQEVADLGAGEILLTSMDRDGTQDGFDLVLTRAVADAVTIPVVASGGAGNPEQLADGVTKGGAAGVLAASIFHFGECTIAEAKAALAERGIPVRPV